MDSAFSLPTLMIIVPAAGGLIAMSMFTRRAALLTSLVTGFIQALLIVIGVVQLGKFAELSSSGHMLQPTCLAPTTKEGSRFVLAQCADWFPQWGVQYHVALSYGALGLVALTTLVTLAACVFSWHADRDRPAPLHGLLWLTAACLIGLFVSRDLIVFYVFFELMLVPLLLLVGVWGAAERVRATMTMFVYTLLGSIPMLVGIIVVGQKAAKVMPNTGERAVFSLPDLSLLVQNGELHLPSWVLLLFVLAFAIKAPLLPFHGWMPISYRQAPIEVTAVLSGLISKAAFFGMLVIVLPLFPTQLEGGWGTALTWIALASLLYGSLAAFRQPDMRGVVAYSSMAQMGLIFLGLSAYTGIGAEQALSGAYLQTINHGLVSAVAFLLVGIVELRSGEHTFNKLGGLATGRARLTSVWLLITLIMLAVPGASTFAGELLILTGVFRGDVSGPLVAILASTAVVLAAMYALRLVAGILFSDREETKKNAASAEQVFGKDIGLRELAIVGPALLVLVGLSVWPNVLHRPMQDTPVAIKQTADPLAKAAHKADGKAHS